MNNLEARVFRLEGLVQSLLSSVSSLQARVGALEQGAHAPTSGTGGGGSGAGAYLANNLNLGAATGTWPSIAPTSTTADVYAESSGSLSKVASAATVYNFGPDATDVTKRQYLASNGDGTYTVVGQSCSAG